MRKLIFIFALLWSLVGRGQTTYDTTWRSSFSSFSTMQSIVTLPPGYYNNTNDSFQCVLFFLGLGEVGTDTSLISLNGPHQYIRSSLAWNTAVDLSGVNHYAIYISLQPQTAYLPPKFVKPIIDSIMKRYRILRSSLHLCGLSMGGWEAAQFIAYQPVAGNHSYAQRIASVVDVEGVKPDDTFDATPAYPGKFTPVPVTGNRFLYFEQNNDGRDGISIVNTFNGSILGSAVYTQTFYGAGNHGHWNHEFGGYWAGNGLTLVPDTYSLMGKTQTVYQWMLRHGDTVNDIHTGALPPNVNAGSIQSITQPTSSLTLSGSASGVAGHTISSNTWTQLSGPVVATITTPSSLTTSVTGMSGIGTYIFQLTAVDNFGLTNSSTVSDTVKGALGAAPVAHAGGTYNVTQANGYDVPLDGSTSTGTNLKFQWAFSDGYYIGNDKSTHLTSVLGEPRILGVKAANTKFPQIIQLKLGGGDSIKTVRIKLTVTDTLQNLSSIDYATIIYRYWHKYPPQNTDGSAGSHVATGADSLVIGPACRIGIDRVISGANIHGISDSAGNIKFTTFQMAPNFLDTFHVIPGAHIWIYGGNYFTINLGWDTAGAPFGPLGDTNQARIIIAPVPNGKPIVQQETGAFGNIRNVRITGVYDPILHLGSPQYQGATNGYAYCDTLFYWRTDNCYRSIAGHGFIITGMSTSKFMIDHVASIRGNFSGITAKFEYSDLASPSTHSQVWWDSCVVAYNFISKAHGEDYYDFGSANVPSGFARNCLLHDNVSLLSGNKLFKTLDLYSGNRVYNNVGLYGSINSASPFEPGVSVGMEASFINYSNSIDHNLIVGTGAQALNILTTNRNTTLFIGRNNRLSNNAWLHSWGPINAFVGQLDSAMVLGIDSNFFGLNGPFKLGEIYNSGSYGVNTPWTINFLPSGSLVGAYTKSTYNVTNNIYDNTKSTLLNGSGNFTNINNTLITLEPFPLFVSAPFTGIFPEQWVDFIYSMWGDEYVTGPEVNQGAQKFYQVGDIVNWFDEFFFCTVSNNTGIPVPHTTANGWTLITWGGKTWPPIDPRLFSNDPYALRGIGLTSQVGPSVINTGKMPLNLRVRLAAKP